MNSTARRVPFTTGLPTRISGSRTILSRQSIRASSVPERPLAGEHHGYAGGVGGGYGRLVLDGAARLDDGADAGESRQLHGIGEREEAIRGQHGPAGPLAGLVQRQPSRAHARHLAAADAQRYAGLA